MLEWKQDPAGQKEVLRHAMFGAGNSAATPADVNRLRLLETGATAFCPFLQCV
ncbi:hypothetical protein D3C75_812660 [compost metagenome]